ncbi:MAG: CHAT domain-containing protein [Cypionkella sp.]|jgi:CHAT domain-containing protein|nr:CHAT domain-containing protein [Cypionkella sp.]
MRAIWRGLGLAVLSLWTAGPICAGDLPQVLTPEHILERVFVSAQRAQASGAGQALTEAGARLAAGSGPLASRLRERQDQTAAIEALQDRLAGATSESGIAAETAARSLQAELDEALARLSRLDAEIDRDFPDYRSLTDPAPLTIAELQALLDPAEALVMILGDETQSYVWAVSPTGADWATVPLGTEALAQAVAHLRAELGYGAEAPLRGAAPLDGGAAPKGRSFDRQAAYRLYADLLGPLDRLIAGADHLLVVADGPLTSLPFSLLVTAPPQGADDDPAALRATPWLIRRQAITTLPTVAALRSLRRPVARDPQEAPRLVGFGDPLLGYRAPTGEPAHPAEDERLAAAVLAPSGQDTIVTRGVYDDIRRVADLAPLPGTARELRALAATIGADRSTLFLGAAATEAQVRAADLSQASVLAFATHGLLTGGLPGLDEPALVFTPPSVPSKADDALLTASEAAQLNLAADLIILSACDTAGSDGRPGAEGLSGLARAFIYAGARAILVSHWPVDDDAASQLTVRMIEAMYGPERQTRAGALRQSMLALMQDGPDRFAHPALWAPFVVVGEGGADRIAAVP